RGWSSRRSAIRAWRFPIARAGATPTTASHVAEGEAARHRREVVLGAEAVGAEARLEERAQGGDLRRAAGEEDGRDRVGRDAGASEHVLHAGADRADVVGDDRLELRARERLVEVDAAPVEADRRCVGRRERRLRLLDRLEEEESVVALDERRQAL